MRHVTAGLVTVGIAAAAAIVLISVDAPIGAAAGSSSTAAPAQSPATGTRTATAKPVEPPPTAASSPSSETATSSQANTAPAISQAQHPATPSDVATKSPSSSSDASAPSLTLSYPPGLGEDQSFPLGDGASYPFEVDISNPGAPTPDAELSLTIPPSLTFDPATGASVNGLPLTCAGPDPTFVCDIGAVESGPPGQTVLTVTFTVSPAARAVPGEDATFTVATVGQVPASSLDGFVHFTGSAELVTSINPTSATVTVGESATFSVALVNHGPQVGDNTISIAIMDTSASHFEITDLQLAAPTPRTTAAQPPAATDPSDCEVFDPGSAACNIGTLGVDAIATGTLTVKALSPGPNEIAMFALSDATNPDCGLASCTFTTLSLTALAPPPPSTSAPPSMSAPPSTSASTSPVHPSSSPPSSPASHRPEGSANPVVPGSGSSSGLAETGVPIERLIGLGAVLIVGGAGLVGFARRPRSRRH